MLATTALLVGRAATFEFLTGDDHLNIVRNPIMRSPKLAELLNIWLAPYEGLYIPCTYTVWFAESWASTIFPSDRGPRGLNPYIFHVGNIVLYLVCVSLVYRFLCRIVGYGGAALAGALFFALHPLHMESVAWITETKNLLAGAFAGACLIHYPFGDDANSVGAQHRATKARYVFSGLCFVASLLSKPSTVTLPLVLIVIDWGIFRRPLRSAATRALPMLVVAVLISGVTVLLQSDERTPHPSLSLDARIALAVDVVWFYTTKAFLPLAICSDYGRSAIVNDTALITLGKGLFVTALLSFLGFLGRRAGLAGAICYLLLLLPVSGLVSGIYGGVSTVADRHMFLPLLGLSSMVAAALASRWGRRELLLTSVAMVALFGISWCELSFWRNDLVHFGRAVELNPSSWNAHAFLGQHAMDSGDWKAAERRFRIALKHVPDWVEVQFQLGLALLHQRRFEDSLEAFSRAKEAEPDNRGVIRQLAWMHASAADACHRRPEAAFRLMTQTVSGRKALDMQDIDVLSVVYAAVGRFDEATRLAQQAQRLYLSAGDRKKAKAAEHRLRLFRNQHAYVEEPPIAP